MSVWISRCDPASVAVEVAGTDAALPLAGLRLAVKDNIDVAGFPTTAGCPAFAYEPAVDATVVQRLRVAGAVVAGKTNLDQFATGLVGTRSPYGAVESPIAPGRVAGGSSSGSAAAVARGEADVALGTDTAGSGRVPAAFCGIVGLKPTRGWLPTTGVVPACRSLDCVSVFAADVATAARVVEAAAGPDPDDPWSRPRPAGPDRGAVRRLGRPSPAVLERWCTPAVVDAFDAALARVAIEVVEVDLAAYLEAGDLLYGGAFVAERHAAVGAFVEAHPDDVDPVVGAIIVAAGTLTASALAADRHRLAVLARRSESLWTVVDAVVVPTAPSHPTIAEVAADPVGVNAALGRFTNATNLLDWCAAAVPAGTTVHGLPFGVSVLGPAWTDREVWRAAALVAGHAPPALAPPPAAEVHLAVCGAHLEGQPLHHQLQARGARLVARTATAPAYRMVCLATTPPKPGLVRVADGEPGAALEVEVWALDAARFGTLVDGVPAPLTIGTVELTDGRAVNGFLCEPHAAAGAPDITAHGGWRAWLAR
ncbi:MAG: allophanate hydrolase [Acidimicrobiales bacterium]